MAEIAEMLKERRDKNELRTDQFAVPMDVPATTMTAYINAHRSIGLMNGRKMIKYFRSIGDDEMADAITEFLLESSQN